MDGISFELQVTGLDAALARLNAMGTVHHSKLLDGLARMGREQTRHRIEHEKTSPEGVPWKPTLDGRAALFVTGKHLSSSIDHAVVGDTAVWGSGWIGARIHQFGGVISALGGNPVHKDGVYRNGRFNRHADSITGKATTALKFWLQVGGHFQFVMVQSVTIPARPYLGVSAENARELEEMAGEYVVGVIRGAIH